MKCSVVYPGQFVVWITCLMKSYEDIIISNLVKNGYIVSAVASDGTIISGEENSAAFIITLRVDSMSMATTVKDIRENIVKIINDNKLYCYSVIVSVLADACWVASNVILNKDIPTQNAGKLN